MPEQDTQQAFCSYCREDSAFALRLAGDLKAAGAHVWLDQLDIVPGQRWDRAVEDALAACPRMLVILSPVSVESTNVMDEVSAALEADKTVIPVIYGDCKIPFRLRRLQHVDFRLDYHIALVQLLKAFGITPQGEAHERQTRSRPELSAHTHTQHRSAEAATPGPTRGEKESTLFSDGAVRRDHTTRERARTSSLDDTERRSSVRRLRSAIVGLAIAAPLLIFLVALGWLSLNPLERTVRDLSFFSVPLLGLIVGGVAGNLDTRFRGFAAGATIGGLNTLVAWPLGWWFLGDTGPTTEVMVVYQAVMLYAPGAAAASGLVGMAVVAVANVLMPVRV